MKRFAALVFITAVALFVAQGALAWNNTVTGTVKCDTTTGINTVTWTSTQHVDEGYAFTGISPSTSTFAGTIIGVQHVTITLTETKIHYPHTVRTQQLTGTITLTTCTKVVPVPPVIPPKPPVVPAGPNADAFCYGTGVDSYAWYTPEQVVSFGWKTLHVAFVVKGIDWSGVMTNGFRPYCGTGTMTGQHVDNQGWWTLDGSGAGFVSFTNPNGTQSYPEHYAVVTP